MHSSGDWPQPSHGGALYKLGVPGFVANEHIGFALGEGRRALNELITAAGSSRRGIVKSASTLADRSAVQNFIGSSEIKLRAARSLAMSVYADASSRAQSGERPAARLQAEIRSATAYCTEVAVDIATGAFRLSGGGAVYRTGALQRCLRDLNVASQHFVVSDVTYENLGKLILGFEDVDPMG